MAFDFLIPIFSFLIPSYFTTGNATILTLVHPTGTSVIVSVLFATFPW